MRSSREVVIAQRAKARKMGFDDPAFGTAVLLLIWFTCSMILGKNEDRKERNARVHCHRR